jgi:transcription-repair coupling factor (superfamily II helicase)
LISKDIEFKDLGLLVVDEEQRFGVAHKERLKTLKPNLDILTLSATPIPRTLHMSMVAIRDISTIEEPPEERFPVQTYVMEYNEQLIRDAIYREMARKGQVFYLYNKVRTIDVKAYEIKNMVPEARVAVAHGQMGERELEDIMQSFIEGNFDVLVCTTIIESGVDMPNVNTMIVEDGDKLGLAQLYQIRGRVGRSNRMAYAYLTYKKDKQLNEVSEKRLQAIKEFTEFGSGFKIAMRDLEIRGAGNLLGSEQHGQMESVGYDMYCKLLDRAVRETRGNAETDEETMVEDFSIDISIDAYISKDYIPREEDRLEIYKKISLINDEEDVSEISDELVDRYGDLPGEVENLISIARLKSLARSKGFVSMIQNKDLIIMKYAANANVSIESIGKVMEQFKRKVLFNAGAEPYIAYRINETNKKDLLNNLRKLFEVY